MKYKVLILKSAEKEMDRLQSKIHRYISNKILALESNPRPHGIKKLIHKEEYYTVPHLEGYELV